MRARKSNTVQFRKHEITDDSKETKRERTKNQERAFKNKREHARTKGSMREKDRTRESIQEQGRARKKKRE